MVPLPAELRNVAERLEATKRGEWAIPLARLASRLREIFGEIHVDYVDMGVIHSFPLTLEIFTLINRDLTVIVYHGLTRKTALAIGNVTEENQGIAEAIWARVRARPMGLGA